MNRRTNQRSSRLLILASLLLLAGCNSEERVVEVATQAADRQADQNRQMSQLQDSVQQERQALSDGWTDLNSQRRQLAEKRRSDWERYRARQGLAVVLVAVLALVLTWQLLQVRPTTVEVDLAALELVFEEGCGTLIPSPEDQSQEKRLLSHPERQNTQEE
ncbi:MAG: hypothetical protein RH917_00520 [Lacipirellulaceae bacterium]